ncbi:MAG TPA: DUF2255 family protein [Thermoanaerobaculia bacterium]|nr:DUF2255 family protein [Thermoanaerobaculia bacterium]
MTDPARGSSTFSPRTLRLLLDSRVLGIRAGDDHKFTGIWFVVVGNRLFVRPWNDKEDGWHRALLRDRRGAITIGDRQIPVRARASRGEAVFDAVDAAYASKYDTKASQKWVRGFAERRRRLTTTELLPAGGRLR